MVRKYKNKGKTYEEIYGDRADSEKKKRLGKTGFYTMEDEKRSEVGKAGAKAVLTANKERMKNGQAKAMGMKSREFENQVADSLDIKYLFLPQSVCDRIAIINGKPILIEIKHKGEKLRPKQKEVQKLLGDSYLVIER